MVLRVGVGKFFSIVHCLQEGQVGVEGFFKTLLRQVFLFQPFYKVVLKVDSGKQNDDEVAVFDVALSVGDLGYLFFLLGFLHNQKLPGLQRQRAWRKAGGIQNEVDVFLRDASLHIKLSASVAFVDYFFHGHGCMRSWMHGCGSFAVGLGCALDASLHCERCGA